MKKLVLSALLLGVLSQAAGCIIVSGDDSTGSANVAWNLRSFNDSTGQVITAGCPAGANRAVIYALPEGQAADPYEDRYFCSDGAGTAADLPVGRYTMWVRLTDDAYVNRFAESASQIVDITKGGSAIVPAYDIQVDHAYYQLSWSLHPGGGAAVPCSSVATENGVSIMASDAGGGPFLETLVDCEEGLAPLSTISRPLPSALGNGRQYTIDVTLLNQQDQVIGTIPTPILPSVDRALDYGNKFVDLGIVNITVN